jgi:hypothetical protein
MRKSQYRESGIRGRSRIVAKLIHNIQEGVMTVSTVESALDVDGKMCEVRQI